MFRTILLASLASTLCLAQEKTPDTRLQNATSAIREIMRTPDKGIPQDLVRKAQCIVVVPDLVKAAFLVGGKYGRGYASCRTGAGDRWSAPAAVRIEGGSFGFQLGASATDLIMLVMNEHGMRQLLTDKFTIGGEAAGAAGPVGRRISADTDVLMKAEILTWSRSRGLFGGVSLDGATLRPDSAENERLYGKKVSQSAILQGEIRPTRASRPFVAEIARMARPESSVASNDVSRRNMSPKNMPGRNMPPSDTSSTNSLNQPGGRMTLGERQVHFATGQSAIPAGADAALSKLAQTLKDNPKWTIRIEGYTDNTGNPDANQALSQKRAGAVMDWLADHGVDRSRMTAKGNGDLNPAADNGTAAGRAKNRRVEIVRTDNTPTGGE